MICIKKRYFLTTVTFTFRSFHIREEKNIMTKVFHIAMTCRGKEKRQFLNNSVFRFSDLVLLSIRK